MMRLRTEHHSEHCCPTTYHPKSTNPLNKVLTIAAYYVCLWSSITYNDCTHKLHKSLQKCN